MKNLKYIFCWLLLFQLTLAQVGINFFHHHHEEKKRSAGLSLDVEESDCPVCSADLYHEIFYQESFAIDFPVSNTSVFTTTFDTPYFTRVLALPGRAPPVA